MSMAWSLGILCWVLLALSFLLLATNHSYPGVRVSNLLFPETVLVVSFSPLGMLIATRRPENPLGWLFCAIGLFGGVDLFCGVYAAYALLAEHGSLPGGKLSAWIDSWVWIPVVALLAFVPLLFPNGRLPSPRWRPFAWFVGVAAVGGIVAMALLPGRVSELGPIENPLGLSSFSKAHDQIEALVEALWYPLIELVALASLFVRFRHAGGVERQQIKWVVYAASVAVVGAILTYGGADAPGTRLAWWVGEALLVVGFGGFPVVMGIAILRYHLYEIDLIINRTLVYGSLTAILVALYFGVIVVFQRVFVALTGERSTLAVVASTLLIAALFNPLRRRVQAFVDRRFYRRKYDAAKTLEAFSSKLRDETDLDALNSDLTSVVRDTMQPAHVSLWLLPELPPKRSQGPE
jgi:hypothetical protein